MNPCVETRLVDSAKLSVLSEIVRFALLIYSLQCAMSRVSMSKPASQQEAHDWTEQRRAC